MLKKFFTGLMAAGMLLATSCQEQEFTPALGEATVTFEVATPEIATRAYSDGMTANKLQYAVYHMNGEQYGTISHKTTDAEIHGTTTLSLQLTAGETYQIILWADAEGAPYTVNFEDKTMIVDYTNVVSNNESLDAFYAVHKFTVTGAQTETVELRRPFAQLNIGTNDYDEAMTASNYQPKQSSVKVKGIYNTLNLAEGTVSGGDDEYVTFNSALIPTGETFPVAGYDYVAMNYVLVGPESVGDEGKSLVEVQFTLTDGTTDKTRTVSSVPVQRNYRTNIYGSILTSDVDVNVEIKPGYNEPANELDDLYNAALNGGEVTLTEDVVLTSPLEVVGDMTINLNGKTVSGNMHKSVGPVIKNNGTLTINGGTISSLANNGGSAIANYGTLTVEDVTINGAPREGDSWPAYPINNYGSMTLTDAVISGYQGCVALNAAGTTVLNNCELTKNYEKTSSHVFYVNHADAKVVVNGGTYNHNGFDGSLAYVNKGEVTINDGTFNAKDGGYGFAVLSGGKVIINGGNINAGLLNWGGQFEVYGGVYTSKPADNLLAEGLVTLKKDNKWYVVPEGVDAVATTADELANVLANDVDVIYVANNTYDALPQINKTVTLVCQEGTIFNGKQGFNIAGSTIIGATFQGVDNQVSNSTAINGIFKDCTFNGDLKYSYAGETVVFENCEFNGDDYAIHFDGNASGSTDTRVILKNCVVNSDWRVAIGAAISMFEATDCVFNVRGFINMWGKATLTNCEFNKPLHWIANVDYSEYTNCLYEGRALTANDLLIEAPVIKINGEYYASSVEGLTMAMTDGAMKVNLTAGEFNEVDFYNIQERETLTIVGTEGTKISFDNLQVRASQFKELKIQNCEILRMPNKSWGHVVFGSSDDAQGVYTLENCIFKGQCSQGVYINEYTSGVTYNILNCTFEGDFGGEGAIAIQNNDGVNHIVNVKGCTFDTNSPKICVLYAYDGWTLNTDLGASDVIWK